MTSNSIPDSFTITQNPTYPFYSDFYKFHVLVQVNQIRILKSEFHFNEIIKLPILKENQLLRSDVLTVYVFCFYLNTEGFVVSNLIGSLFVNIEDTQFKKSHELISPTTGGLDIEIFPLKSFLSAEFHHSEFSNKLEDICEKTTKENFAKHQLLCENFLPTDYSPKTVPFSYYRHIYLSNVSHFIGNHPFFFGHFCSAALENQLIPESILSLSVSIARKILSSWSWDNLITDQNEFLQKEMAVLQLSCLLPSLCIPYNRDSVLPFYLKKDKHLVDVLTNPVIGKSGDCEDLNLLCVIMYENYRRSTGKYFEGLKKVNFFEDHPPYLVFCSHQNRKNGSFHSSCMIFDVFGIKGRNMVLDSIFIRLMNLETCPYEIDDPKGAEQMADPQRNMIIFNTVTKNNEILFPFVCHSLYNLRTKKRLFPHIGFPSDQINLLNASPDFGFLPAPNEIETEKINCYPLAIDEDFEFIYITLNNFYTRYQGEEPKAIELMNKKKKLKSFFKRTINEKNQPQLGLIIEKRKSFLV